jgi:hemolysin III
MQVAPLETSLKPRLRGVSHKWAFFVSLLTGSLLLVLAPGGKAAIAVAIYAVSLSALFGTSALYHRVTWRPSARRWMRRLDHSMIFLLIAGTYTPFCLLVLNGGIANTVLAVVWGGALGGIVLKLVWIDAPKWLVAAVYVALGWVAVAATPQILDHAGAVALGLILAGGLLYTAGAIVYALRKPDPAPAVFGYHEVFHALVIGAAALHYAAVAFFALPGG